MTYVINAWLDCAEPRLTVFNKQSGTKMLSFDSEEINELLAAGDLCLPDLLSNNHRVLEEMVRALALHRCILDTSYTC